MRITVLCLALSLTTCGLAQTTLRPKKILTLDQIAYQVALKTYNAERDRLLTAANSAFDAEAAREKAPECPGADTTYAINMCLSHEVEVTAANYKAFTSGLRAVLALPRPTFSGETTPIIGPTGPEATPATNTAAFDTAEAAWRTYATAECNAVDTYWRGGTIVNAMVGECNLRIARARLHEMDNAYDMLLHH